MRGHPPPRRPGGVEAAATPGLYLGIDPGLASTGWAIMDPSGRIVGCGTIRTPPGADGPRLVEIARQVRALAGAHPVAEAAMEQLFMGRNRTSVIGVAQARGVILCELQRAGVPTYEYKPAQVKSVVTGYGAADKAQVARMLSAQGVFGHMDDHAADAIAIALCHSRSRRLLMAAGGAPGRAAEARRP